MKRVLWVCNIMLPAIGQELHLPYSNREGWLSGIFEKVKKKEAPFKLGVCFPMSFSMSPSMSPSMAAGDIGALEGEGLEQDGERGDRQSPFTIRHFTLFDADCYGFTEDLGRPEIYSQELEEQFKLVIGDFKPDMIHIFGTEFPHCLAAVKAFGKPDRTLIGIQGLCGEIAKVYMAGLPEKVQNQVTLRDFLRRDSIRQQQEKFFQRGKHESEAIAGCGNITGRTRFDREGTARINPAAKYYHMNETMRSEFYTGRWKLEECEEHRIFLGQGDYPLKGMHFVLEAMARLLPKYPDVKLYVAGNSVIDNKTLKEKLKLPAYGKYLLALMKKYGLKDKVIMLGKLSASEMKEQFLICSVYVCPSVLENSPNTVGEAQLLGVPVAASAAGGIPDMIEDGKDGLLFPAGDIKGLAGAIERIWDRTGEEKGTALAQRISREAQKRAGMAHDGENNYLRLLEIYKMIGERE